jgi:predicted DNA-binding transcriptional regulator AlpA
MAHEQMPVQKKKLPKFLIPLIAAAVACVATVVVFFAVGTGGGSSGGLSGLLPGGLGAGSSSGDGWGTEIYIAGLSGTNIGFHEGLALSVQLDSDGNYKFGYIDKEIEGIIITDGGLTAEEIEFMTLSIKQAREMAMHLETSLDINEVCEELGLAKSSVYEWVKRGWLPKPTKVEKVTSFWTKEDVEKAKKLLQDS